MILYHYTCDCPRHLGSILAEGRIRVTESNVSPTVVHAAPDVVWLTRSEHPRGTQGLEGGPCDKTSVRITVAVPDAHHWPEWSKGHGMNPRWRRALERGKHPQQWYVVERPISGEEWQSVEYWPEGTPAALLG